MSSFYFWVKKKPSFAALVQNAYHDNRNYFRIQYTCVMTDQIGFLWLVQSQSKEPSSALSRSHFKNFRARLQINQKQMKQCATRPLRLRCNTVLPTLGNTIFTYRNYTNIHFSAKMQHGKMFTRLVIRNLHTAQK